MIIKAVITKSFISLRMLKMLKKLNIRSKSTDDAQ